MEYAWFDAVHTTTESSSSWWKQEDLSSSSFSAVERFLQDDGGTTTTQSDSTILRTTFKVYGLILLVSFILFCFLRQRCPRPYNIRNWVEKIKTPLADDQYGFFSWMWKMNAYTEDELLDECGMDSLCYLRLIYMGYRICGICVFNAIWLMPIYKYSNSDNGGNVDPVVEVTVSNVPTGSPFLVATVVAAYVLFGFIMRLILKEFNWFIEFRHKYLRKPKPRNYSIFVCNIPLEYRSNSGLETFFQQCFAPENILEARLRIKAPKLQKAVEARDSLIAKFEHALAYEKIHDAAFMVSRSKLMGGESVRGIQLYTSELQAANDDITKRIEDIELLMAGQCQSSTLDDIVVIDTTATNEVNNRSNGKYQGADVSLLDENDGFREEYDANELEISRLTDDKTELGQQDSQRKGFRTMQTVGSTATSTIKAIASQRKVITSGVNLVSSGAVNIATSGLNLLKGIDEGEYYDSGFVSFKNLCTTNAALQMVHHEKPFDIEVHNAPDPEDIFWNNVGRSHKDIQIGRLISKLGTVAICLLWTIPMSFVASLSTVEQLKSFGFVANIINAVPILEPILQQLAPLFVIIVNSFLPAILKNLSMREGPVSTSVVEASLFTKLAAFSIIQTFFVSFLGGGIIAKMKDLLLDPMEIFNILATELPTRSTFFIQLIFVSNAISLTMEMLRVIPLLMAFIRKFLSPKLTEEERRRTVFGIRPLADPSEFDQAANLSNIVLVYMVMLVYAVIAPLTSFIIGFCFAYMHVCFKHQFVFIYPTLPDSGGKIWADFMKILMTCMLISEITIVGLMGLKQATIATPLMFPLIAITVLFNAYVRQQHFRVTEFLPSRACLKTDLQNGPEFDLRFLKDAYLQEELRTKVKTPDIPATQRIALERQGVSVNYETMSTTGTAYDNHSRV